MQDTKIEWADITWNPVRGCSHVSEACKNCYAEKMASRMSGSIYKGLTDKGRWNGKVQLNEAALVEPGKRKKPSRIFLCSMGDLFHENVPYEYIDMVILTIAQANWHTFLLLSKRTKRMAEYFSKRSVPRNLWVGTTIENQNVVDKRCQALLSVDAVVRFVSCEPLLGPIYLSEYIGYNPLHGGGKDVINWYDRKLRVPIGEERGNRDQRGWDSLAHCGESGKPMEQECDSEESRTSPDRRDNKRGISDGEDNAEWEASDDRRSPFGVPTLFRDNSTRTDSKPQERNKERQLSLQLGTGYLCGADAPCTGGSTASRKEPEWGTERYGEIDRESCSGNKEEATVRGNIGDNSERLCSDNSDHFKDCTRTQLETLDLVICGGETGLSARPMHPDWARSLRDQCKEYNVPFFFKSWGTWKPSTVVPPIGPMRHHSNLCAVHIDGHSTKELTPGMAADPNWAFMVRATRESKLDGVEHKAIPEGTRGGAT